MDPAIESTVPYLHVYGQAVPHADAYIVATPAALQVLKALIDVALSLETQRGAMHAFVTDGEGFTLTVCSVDEATLFKTPAPYSDESFVETRPDRLSPHEIATRTLPAKE